MSLVLSAVMDELGVRLATISGLRVFDFPPKSAQAPFAFVDFPQRLDYDATYGRGSDRLTLDVYVAVANQVSRSTRDAIVAYCGTAAGSVKNALEGSTTSFTTRVTAVEFGQISLASGDFFGAVFTLDIAG
jgi:hypothetical protein